LLAGGGFGLYVWFKGGEQRSLLSIGAVAALATLLRRLASAPLHGEAAPFASHLLIQVFSFLF
jgi:hypothetical protein